MRRAAAGVGAALRERPGRWTRVDAAAAAAIALAVVLRWPDRATTLLTWDSHTFTLALERYDVNALRPHAPGYPVYVALGRLAAAVFSDPVEGYIALSVACCAAGAILTYAVGRRLASRGLALAAAALVLAAPLLHVHSMTANSYAADLAFSAAVALAAVRAHEAPSAARTVVLAAAFAVAVGVRQSLALFLAPLVAWAALRPPWDVRTQALRLLPAAGAGLAIGLAWFLPMASASGGVATWRRANALQSEVVFERPVWEDAGMLAVNAQRMAEYLRWELRFVVPLAAALALVGLAARARGQWPQGALSAWLRRRDVQALAIWGLPALAFYLTVYSGYGNGPSGYALLLLPPLALAATAAGWWGIRQLAAPPAMASALAAILLAAAAGGLVQHAHDVGDGQYKEHDAWAASWAAVRDEYPPSNTTLVSAYNFAHLWHYYRDYHVVEYRPPGRLVGEVPDFLLIQEAKGGEAWPDWYDAIAAGGPVGTHPLPEGTRHLVLFDFQLAGENGGERQVRPEHAVREHVLRNGWRILVVDTVEGRTLLEDYFGAGSERARAS